MKKHIVSFSGGIGSYMAAKRVAAQYGTDNLILVFADTKMEDEDLYRFIEEASKDIGGQYIKLEDGRDVWEVFFQERFIGNTRAANCTRNLKQEVFREWLEKNYKPDECIVYLGFDWTEPHRIKKATPHWEPYTVVAPMCDEPYLDKEQMCQFAESLGIKRPRLYELGFQHNNCGGFCVKAGHGHFKQLLEMMPERFHYHEEKEQEFRRTIGKDVSILRNRKGGKTLPLTLKEFRENIQNKCTLQLELDDFGGCGCFSED